MKQVLVRYSHDLCLDDETQINLGNLSMALDKRGFITSLPENLNWLLHAKKNGVSLVIPKNGHIVINISNDKNKREINVVLGLVQDALMEKGIIEVKSPVITSGSIVGKGRFKKRDYP